MELLKEPRPSNAVVLGVLRVVRGLKVPDLARCTQVPQDLLYRYEAGSVELTPERLVWLARMMGYAEPEQVVQEAGLYSEALLACWSGRLHDEDPIPLPWWESRHISKMAATTAVVWGRLTREQLTRKFRAIHRKEEREAAEQSWERLKLRTHVERVIAVEVAEEFKNWALVVLVCEKSRSATAKGPNTSRELAELAVRVAELIPSREHWRQRLVGYAMCHLANAVRAAGDIPAAATIFAKGKELWNLGEQSDPGLLDKARVLELEASLRRDERDTRTALALLEAAEACGGSPVKIALKKASTLEQAGEYSRAVAILDCEPPVECRGRDLLGWRFNLAVNLCHLNRHLEAAAYLPEIRALAAEQENPVDLCRVVWLKGRISGGLGQREEGIAAFRQARKQFLAWRNAFDAALVTLELATVLLNQGELDEVGELACQLPVVLRWQGLHEEAKAALSLFCEAVERQTVSEELTRRLVAYLYRARHDRDLRFEPVVT